MKSRTKFIIFGIVMITSLVILVVKFNPEKYTIKDKSRRSSKDNIVYKKIALIALREYKKRLYSILPKAANNIVKFLGKSRLYSYAKGRPLVVPLPKGVNYETSSQRILEVIRKTRVKPGYYVKFDLRKLGKEKDHEHCDDGGNGKDYNIFEIIDLFLTNISIYFITGNQSIENIGYLIELFAGVSFDMEPTTFVGDNVWRRGGEGFVPRNTELYSGSWERRVVIEDSEISAMGNDFYGLTAFNPNTQGNWYASAGVENREQLVVIPMSDNLGYGRSDLSVRKTLPCFNRRDGEFGQGAYIGFRNFTDWSVFPAKCDVDRFTKLSFRYWGYNISAASIVNVRDRNGQLTSTNGMIGLNFDWVAYDKTTKYILVPDGETPSRCVLYDVDIDEYVVNVTAKKVVQIIKSSDDTLSIVAACFGCDGMLYAITNNYDGLQGIVVFKPDVSSDRSWTLREVNTISLDVNDTLVGITGVTDPYLVQTENYPILTVLEINDDYFTQDNLTLHKVTPRDAYTGGSYGVSSEATEWREAAQEVYCFGGIIAYNSGSTLNYSFTTRDEPIKITHTSLRGFENYLDSIGFTRDINLFNVEIYDNQCLASNYWKYSDGERQTVRGTTQGYTVYLRDKLIRNDGKINGWMLTTLLHELIHVRQYVQLGESQYQFGCAYAEAKLFSELEYDSSYSLHPMEIEARRFVRIFKVTDEIATEYNIPINRSNGRNPFSYPASPTTCGPQ